MTDSATETKQAGAIGTLGTKLANPFTILIAIIAFLGGNLTRPINFKGCNVTADSTSATGTVIGDSVIQGINLDSNDLDKFIQHRKDSLHVADSLAKLK